jgi:RNA polymerase sigma-70 factor, ECF subfamily
LLNQPSPLVEPSCDVTGLLRRIGNGEPEARALLMEALYPELRRMAAARMRAERLDHTLQPTALVNEFFLEVARSAHLTWKDRGHFLSVASQAMRRFLIDHARAHNAQRRTPGLVLPQIQMQQLGIQSDFVDAAVIGDILDRLGEEEPRMARVVDMHCFGGLTFDEIAKDLDINSRTAKRDWQIARAWIRSQLERPNQ